MSLAVDRALRLPAGMSMLRNCLGSWLACHQARSEDCASSMSPDPQLRRALGFTTRLRSFLTWLCPATTLTRQPASKASSSSTYETLSIQELVAILESEGRQTWAIAISGTLAYVLERSSSGAQGGLRVVDISDVHNLRTVSYRPLDDTGVDLTVVGGAAYVLSYNGFIVLDVTNPQRPTAVCSMYMEQGGGLAVRNTYAFVTRRGGLSVIDVANPANCTQVGTLNLAGSSTSIAMNGNIAYIGQDGYTRGLNTVDITNPQQPQALGFLSTPYPPYGIAAANGRVYLTNFGLRVIDAQDPAHPRRKPNGSAWVARQLGSHRTKSLCGCFIRRHVHPP